MILNIFQGNTVLPAYFIHSFNYHQPTAKQNMLINVMKPI